MPKSAARPAGSALYLRDEELRQGVRLLFLAYLDLFDRGGEAPAAARLGSAHRRALYFIGRRPGISVAELLEILKITKQSLGRVISELICKGLVERKPGLRDRRTRQLKLTAKGAAMDQAIWKMQRPLIARACRRAGAEASAGFHRVLRALAGEPDADKRKLP
ncbi:MAG TPA: MarR family transcriptional regulator [Rhizomicrobium sp.]|jgi:DNA-binding MarR family transcriptional regulator